MKVFERFDLTEYDNATLWLVFLSVLGLSVGVTGWTTHSIAYGNGYDVGFEDGKEKGIDSGYVQGQAELQEELSDVSTIYLNTPGEMFVRQWGIHLEDSNDLVCQFSFTREYLTGLNSRMYNGTSCGWTESDISEEWVDPDSDRYMKKTLNVTTTDRNETEGDES